jgi:predicted transcriptional regulator
VFWSIYIQRGFIYYPKQKLFKDSLFIMDMKFNSGRKPMTKIDVWLSPDRGKIVNLISKNPKTISDLEKELKINRGTLKHHLKILKEHKIITRRKENHLSGKPVFIELVKDVKPPTVGEMSSKQITDFLMEIIKQKNSDK